MIKEIKIQEFRIRHKKTIQFAEGVTTIIGSSYLGKSTIIKALKWVVRNKPAGDSVINCDADKAVVRIALDEDTTVTRVRGKGKNTYKLNKKVFTAFGNDVPKDIAELLNLSDINFQSQHSAPFWFCETAGEVSRQLNSIVNLELIDRTHSNIASELRKTNLVIEITEEALSRATQQKKKLCYIKDLNQDIKNVEKLQNQYEEDTQKHSIIDEKINLVQIYTHKRENRLEQATEGLRVLHIGDRYRKTADLAERLSRLVKSAQNLQNIIKIKPPSILPLEKLRKRTEQITGQYTRLDSLIKSVESRRQERCQMGKILKTFTKELEEIADGRCPLCGAKMKK